MNNDGPIIVIEDDLEDQFLIGETFKNLAYTNPVLFFEDGVKALNYLNETDAKPLLILSDINLPRINGMEVRDQVKQNDQIDVKCIPYLFFTTSPNHKIVVDAYCSSVQGFFQKPASFQDFEKTIQIIVDYWKVCIRPDEC
ncbi:response regulator [Dyadobacter sp. CY345]|uniref:response regulator n=1 Tax=Dyadobacter sp. CY345 TaxID=2909335 RepID=UPI001F3187EB|nr:response regulator [Dyadobacter sp. CY345]MCF2442321.1 response regulator [Dyadobacter sp. CY345]